MNEIKDSSRDTTVSAYDMLPEEDREALRWVREHGGLEEVWKRLMPDGYEWDDRLSGAVEFFESMHDLLYTIDCEEDHDGPEMVQEVMRRLMPEGMEWPRYDTGEPLKLDDEVAVKNCEPVTVRFISFDKNGFSVRHTGGCRVHWFTYGERVKRPAKVLDADGAEIRVGDTVYRVGMSTFDPEYNTLTVTDIRTKPGLTTIETKNSHDGYLYGKPEDFTHRAPVLAADGRPLRVGDTVWDGKGNGPYIIKKIEDDGIVRIDSNGLDYFASEFFSERPDSWERLEDDATMPAATYCERMGIEVEEGRSFVEPMARDLVRRARALAERERVE